MENETNSNSRLTISLAILLQVAKDRQTVEKA